MRASGWEERMMLRNRLAHILLSISLTLVTVVATGLFGTQAGATTAIPPNFDTSRLAGSEAELAVAINPTNPQNVVTLATLSTAKAGLAEGVTFDGGNHWTSTVIGTGGSDAGPRRPTERLHRVAHPPGRQPARRPRRTDGHPERMGGPPAGSRRGGLPRCPGPLRRRGPGG